MDETEIRPENTNRMIEHSRIEKKPTRFTAQVKAITISTIQQLGISLLLLLGQAEPKPGQG
jgi:hypothetical protein